MFSTTHNGVPIQLYHGDSLDLIPKLDLQAVKLVLTDPPYGRGVDLRRQSKTQAVTTLIGDHSPHVGQAICDWAETNGLAAVVFSSPMTPWQGKWRQHLVWSKGGAVGMGDLRRAWKPSWELIQVARNTPLRGKRDVAVLHYPISARDLREHPTAKPVALLRYLIEQLTDPGDLVFDPFMGIGSTGLACAETGRAFVGIEIDEAYYRKAEERLGASATASVER